MTNLDEVKKLQTALKAIVARYEKKNPIRTADFHGEDCGCYRCAVDGCDAAVNALPELIERVERLEGALKELHHAVCGETGFAAAVRSVSKTPYPWPALDFADERARAALKGADDAR
jgi:hypothetical protein